MVNPSRASVHVSHISLWLNVEATQNRERQPPTDMVPTMKNRSRGIVASTALFLLNQHAAAFVFPPPRDSLATTLVHNQYPSLLTRSGPLLGDLHTRGRSTELALVPQLLDALESIPPDFDLGLGVAVIAAAMTPYVLGLFLPNILKEKFFVNIYRDDRKETDEVRDAEIYWKLMFATLGLGNITYIFIAAINRSDITQVLRDCYILWALFYLSATWKVRKERHLLEKRGFIQAWHLLVSLALLVDVGIRPEFLSSLKGL